MKQQVAVLDYGCGNIHSVSKAIENAGSCQVIVTSDAEVILKSDRVVLPGVGAMGECLRGLKKRSLDKVIKEIAGKKPLMGICVGMQILADFGEENSGVIALGIFPGSITAFPRNMLDMNGEPLRVPHMGWNQVKQNPHPIWRGIHDLSRFYFVHSFRYSDITRNFVAGTCDHGQPFAAALSIEGIFAVQFHPEKSHANGLQLYANFLHWDGSC